MSLFDWIKFPTLTVSHHQQLTAGALAQITLGQAVIDPVLQFLQHKTVQVRDQGSGQEW